MTCRKKEIYAELFHHMATYEANLNHVERQQRILEELGSSWFNFTNYGAHDIYYG